MRKLTLEEYNNECDKILKSGLPVHEILIALLDFAGSVKIVKKKRKEKNETTP